MSSLVRVLGRGGHTQFVLQMIMGKGEMDTTLSLGLIDIPNMYITKNWSHLMDSANSFSIKIA